MTANQFRAALVRLELSQLEAARLFGYNDRTVRRWAIGERRVPPAIAAMLRLLLDGKMTVNDLRREQ